MPDRPVEAETVTLAEYLEAHLEKVVRRVLNRIVWTMLLCTLGAVVVLVGAEVYTLKRVQSNTELIADVEALTASNRRWVQVLKTDQDLQSRRYEHIAGQIAQIRGLMDGRKAAVGGKRR